MSAPLSLRLMPDALKELHARLKVRDVLPSVRTRLLVVLYYHQGHNADSIARLGVVTALTAGRIRRAYEAGGFAALEDRARPGRTSAFTAQMRARALELVRQDNTTWNCTTLLEVLHDEFGLELDPETLRTHLKAMGLSWQRTRLVAPPTPDPEQVQAMKDDLDVLKKGPRTAS